MAKNDLYKFNITREDLLKDGNMVKPSTKCNTRVYKRQAHLTVMYSTYVNTILSEDHWMKMFRDISALSNPTQKPDGHIQWAGRKFSQLRKSGTFTKI